jgi:hypothetical protein
MAEALQMASDWNIKLKGFSKLTGVGLPPGYLS